MLVLKRRLQMKWSLPCSDLNVSNGATYLQRRDAPEWRPSISCNDIPDRTQKEKKLWAFDKPSIPQPPLGWKRIVKIRTRGTNFADVYMKQHSEYASQAVKPEKFSFKTPRSLQQDYAKKRSSTPPTPSDYINGDNAGMSMCMCM
uniref:MBD domain-containing protein n=1 Tax=Solanum lycopersicum TaxID=4081 RepID=K4CYX1_SOLLC